MAELGVGENQPFSINETVGRLSEVKDVKPFGSAHKAMEYVGQICSEKDLVRSGVPAIWFRVPLTENVSVGVDSMQVKKEIKPWESIPANPEQKRVTVPTFSFDDPQNHLTANLDTEDYRVESDSAWEKK